MGYRSRIPRPLAAGYTFETDVIAESEWNEVMPRFRDANLYQTWAYGAVTSGLHKPSHVVLRKCGEIVAIAQARVVRVPLIPCGIAYVRWGPLWQCKEAPDAEVFRQAVRALRNEFVCKRGLTLRLYPLLFDVDRVLFEPILAGEGFAAVRLPLRERTILMDLRPPEEALRDGMRPHWKRELKLAERNGLEIERGTGDDLFGAFVDVYREMVRRKDFIEPNDINLFRIVQRRLPEHLKMRILLCRSGGQVHAGVVASSIGDSALYLFGATGNSGLKSRGSYALQAQLISDLKKEGITTYDLNGVNPKTNPGTYKFKADLAGRNGRETAFLGRFEARRGLLTAWCLRLGDALRAWWLSVRAYAKHAPLRTSDAHAAPGLPA